MDENKPPCCSIFGPPTHEMNTILVRCPCRGLVLDGKCPKCGGSGALTVQIKRKIK